MKIEKSRVINSERKDNENVAKYKIIRKHIFWQDMIKKEKLDNIPVYNILFLQYFQRSQRIIICNCRYIFLSSLN